MQVQVQLCGLPIVLVCEIYQGGRVAFVKATQFNTIFDEDENGELLAVFDHDEFELGGETFSYNTYYLYKQIPTMLRWLQRQNLQSPEM